MNLQSDKSKFRDAIRFTAQKMELKPEYVEKDYWVTYVLFTIFNSEIGTYTVFKGGTALSKCYQLIDRFSEDIDLVVFRNEADTNNKLNTKIRTISDIVSTVVPEIPIEGITRKMGMNRKTAHYYGKEFTADYGQVRDFLVVESTWLGYYEPYTTRSIVSFVGKMMLENGQSAMAKEFGLLPFEVRVLEPTRTICEKIMSLVRFSYSLTPIDDLKNKIRHTYDLHQLLMKKEYSDFLKSSAFDEMLLKVAHDDIGSYKNNNKWLLNHPKEALFFSDIESVWKQMVPTYKNDFKELVYGNLPDDKRVKDMMILIRDRLATISWDLEITS